MPEATPVYATRPVTVGNVSFKTGEVVATISGKVNVQDLVTLLTGGRASEHQPEIPEASAQPESAPAKAKPAK